MKKIETKKDIKLFRREIKKELKDILSNVEDNLDGNLAFELLNEDDDYICHIFAREGMCLPDSQRITYDSISVENFMYGNGFELNKDTSDYKLNKVVNRIIEDYNDQVDWEKVVEYGKASEEIEAECREIEAVCREIEAEWSK